MTTEQLPILITGATGFIGSRLTERLLALGVRVRILARSREKAAPLAALGAEVIVGDLTDSTVVQTLCDGCRLVCHGAAWLGTPYTKEVAWKVNVTGTAALAAAAVRAKVTRFVHLSSIAVYGPVREGVITEDWPLWTGVDLYGDSKIAGEAVLQDAARKGLPLVILRPGLVYGPHGRGWTLRFVDWIGAGRPAMVAGGHGYCWPVFVDNLVDAILLAMDRSVTGNAFTIVDTTATWREFLGYYAHMLHKPIRSVPLVAAYALALGDELRAFLTRTPPRIRPTAIGYTVSRARHNTRKATHLLGWTPRIALPEGMLLTERWLKEQGYLPV